MSKPSKPLKIVTLPSGMCVAFRHRDDMKKVARNRATAPLHVAPTTLPVDCTGDATVACPMDGNDQLGDCGPVMCAHVNGIRSYGQGKPGFSELQAPLAALESQYETVSGGDNGTDEDMLVGASGGPDGAAAPGIWLSGIAGDPTAIVVDHLDVDPSNVPLIQYCHDWFYGVCMAWSVPDAFLSSFSSGGSFLDAMTPDPDNGHFTPLSDVDQNGNYRLWTWGGWVWVSQVFVMSVDPETFTTFSPLQFLKSTGYDSRGRHVSDVAAAWIAIGGNASIAQGVVSQFPVKSTGSNPPSAGPSAGPSAPPPAAA